MTTPLDAADLLRTATARGLLPEGAALAAQETRPWPVVLLIALGAWLAAVPLLAVVGMLLGGVIAETVGVYIVGALLLAAAVVLLRARELPTFVEQLALPALLVGGGALGYGLFRDLPDRTGAALLCAVALVLCVLVDRPWLRVLLGAGAAALFMGFVVPFDSLERHHGLDTFWIALHGTLAAWIAASLLQDHALASGDRSRWAALVESVAAGWLLPVLAGLAVHSGMTMFVTGNLGSFWGAMATSGRSPSSLEAALQGVSFALAAGAVLLAGRRWPTLRRPAAALAGVVLAGLAFFLPALGATLLALALTATSQRWRLAGAAAFAAAWIVGAFYYQLAWPLATKAAVLAAAGALLGAAAWLAARGPRPAAAGAPLRSGGALVLGTAVLILAAANFSIWQKEQLIAHGERVYVRLAPVDPRSLMQGDFMRLEFAVPGASAGDMPHLAGGERPYAVARRDQRGVAQLLRIARAGEPLAAGESRIELTPKGGRWILVSDAWFFREGEAARFERARYGEFRVMPDGRALLVGMADEQLRNIEP